MKTPLSSKPKTLLCIGDCNTFPDKLLPKNYYLATQIQQSAHGTIELKNYGRGMASTREGLGMLKDNFIPSDYVTINFGLVDSWVTSLPKLYISYYPYHSKIRKYPRKWLKILKKKLRYLKNYIPRGNVVPKDEYIRNIKAIIEICRKESPKTKILIWTTPYAQNNETRNIEIKKYNEFLKQTAREMKCLLCDTATVIDCTDPENYLDEVHLSQKATKTLGHTIATLLQK